MKPKSVLVIGAGTGGITAAILLARAGFHVTVLEKNAHLSGVSYLKSVEVLANADLPFVFQLLLPPDAAARNLDMKGSTHGLSHELSQMAWPRLHNRHSQYQKLFFVGSSTHPGTGIPMAMVSGRRIARRIQDELS